MVPCITLVPLAMAASCAESTRSVAGLCAVVADMMRLPLYWNVKFCFGVVPPDLFDMTQPERAT